MICLFLRSYLREGFLHLQKLVGEAIVQWKAEMAGSEFEPVDVTVRVSLGTGVEGREGGGREKREKRGRVV